MAHIITGEHVARYTMYFDIYITMCWTNMLLSISSLRIVSSQCDVTLLCSACCEFIDEEVKMNADYLQSARPDPFTLDINPISILDAYVLCKQ